MARIKIPPSSTTISVSIIDTTAWARNLPCADLFYPRFKGLKTFDICSYAFLVTHDDAKGRRHVLFDLGIRKDWRNLVPDTVKKLGKWKADVTVEKDVSEILSENGVDLNDIEAIILR